MSDQHINPNPQLSNPRPTCSPTPHRLPEHIEPSNSWSRPTPLPSKRK